VPNVRFNVAKALDRLVRSKAVEPAALASSVRPTLSALAADSDADVRYYATRALSALSA
jgi:serine/threonine-protein phosphatase 2A regulatory subunit A